MRIGIIGGNGSFGQWLSNFFQLLGHEVLVSDIGTKLTNRQLVEQAEITIFSVPISKTVEVIEEIVPFSRESTLWLDVTSLKTEAVNAMLKSKASVIGMHPMFKPSSLSMQGQTIILCPGRANNWLSWLIEILKKHGAKIKIMDPEEHDQIMAYVQGFTHIPLLSGAHALQETGADLSAILDVASPIYKMRFAMMSRILAGNPDLYADIAIENPNTAKVMSSLLVSVQRLLEAVVHKDKEAFVQLFQETADYFGNFTEEAVEYTDFLIAQMVEFESQK